MMFLSSFNDMDESHYIMLILVFIGSSHPGIPYENNTYIVRNGHP